MGNIGQMIKALARQGANIEAQLCIVTAVDDEARTVDCEPLDESAPLLGVNLQANQNLTSGLVLIPKVGSYVIVALMNDGVNGCVIATDEIVKAEVVIGDTSIVVTESGIVLNGGELGGLVKVAELEDNLNQLKDYVETLKRATSEGIKAVGSSTAASGPTGAATFDEAMSSASIDFKDMENEKVKQ